MVNTVYSKCTIRGFDSHSAHHKINLVRELEKKECGNCQHWMKKSDCPRETGNVKTGSPTMGSVACSKFTLDWHTNKLMIERCLEATEFAAKHGLEIPIFAILQKNEV